MYNAFVRCYVVMDVHTPRARSAHVLFQSDFSSLWRFTLCDSQLASLTSRLDQIHG